MTELTINYLPYYRLYYIDILVHFLCKIKDENKKKIKFNILTSVPDKFNSTKLILQSKNIITDIIQIPDDNYMQKINFAVSEDSEYSMKLDEDCIINNYGFDVLIENLNILDDDKNILYAPNISIGIPSVELFIEKFLKHKKEFYWKGFNNTTMPSVLWDMNYESLNNKLENWNPDFYYSLVKKLSTYYKGIHPIRVNQSLQQEILNDLILNFSTFMNYKSNNDIITLNRPYFCNSTFIIKTKMWKKILDDKSLFRDHFDEVPINLYRDINNKDIIMMEDVPCIHVVYNTIGAYREMSNSFYNSIKHYFI